LSLLVPGLGFPVRADDSLQAPPPMPKSIIVMTSDGWGINTH
jgi:hypothetical protein